MCQSHTFILCTLRVAFPGGVILSLLATLPASCTARLDLQQHHPWFVASELSVAPLVFLDLCMHPGQERPPCVLSWSVCLLSLCLLLFSLLQQSLLAETWGREGPEVEISSKRRALLDCLSSRQPKGLRPSSSFQAGVVMKLENRFHGPR